MTSQPYPIDIVGSSVFGRYPKISASKTYNMIISDDWLVPYAGYNFSLNVESGGQGRGLFSSNKFNHLISVISNDVFIIDPSLIPIRVGTIETNSGVVSIAENNNNQIAICDKKNIYIFNYQDGTFVKANIDFTPSWIAFQDGYFISGILDTAAWRLSAQNNGLEWTNPVLSGRFQTKPDSVVAVIPAPGREGLLYIMGNTVTEIWTDVGAQLFPYQRANSINIDYGCANPATIAASDNFIVWLGQNEKSGLAILTSSGGDAQQISSDGINFLLSQLNNPTNSYGFLFKQDGHLFYQLTFPSINDNLTIVYDFNTKKFFHLCDENMNYHIAKRVAYFNNKFYFISFNDGNLYELGSKYTTYKYTNDIADKGKEIPRIRVSGNFRIPTDKDGTGPGRFVVEYFSLLVEQGSPKSQQFTILDSYKGLIGSSADFPVRSSVQIGDFYNIEAAGIVDNDVTKTNTGKSFNNGDQIVWNGADWALVNENTMRADVSISRDGGESFSNYVGMRMAHVGSRQNKFIVWNLGIVNELTVQLRLWGMDRFVLGNGVVGARL